MAIKKCKVCGGKDLFTAIDLGKLPIAGAFLKNNTEKYKTYKTKMMVCQNCGHGQISKDIDPKKMYVDYNWRTSTSKSYLEYIWSFAEDQIIPEIRSGDWVLEIASNDGYLLKYLKDRGVDVLGVDPAKNISLYATSDGVPVITDFFSSDLAKEIFSIKGSPRWIIANNVLAHTPNIFDFMKGISLLSDHETIITIENPTIMNILEKQHFDVIFHEHYSYLSANSVSLLSKKNGLNLIDVEHVPSQGGSNRYWISKKHGTSINVEKLMFEEVSRGLKDPKQWGIVSKKIKKKILTFSNKVESLYKSGDIICGLAASAKSSVIVNFAKIRPGRILAIADDVKEKQGHFVPGARSLIISTEDMLKLDPGHIIIFAWNIKDELEKKLIDLGYKGKVWTWNGV
jgi:hypothetical protein